MWSSFEQLLELPPRSNGQCSYVVALTLGVPVSAKDDLGLSFRLGAGCLLDHITFRPSRRHSKFNSSSASTQRTLEL